MDLLGLWLTESEETVNTEQLKIRLPADVKDFIDRKAKRNASSRNSVIVACIRDRMEKMATTGNEIGVLVPVVAGNNDHPQERTDVGDDR